MSRVTATKTGTIATIKSPGRVPIRNLKVNLSPVQSGTGDPSPSNVRPITGWTGVNVTQEGINLFDKNAVTHNKYIDSSGAVVNSPTGYDWCITDYMPINGAEKISYRHNGSAGSAPYSAWYDAGKNLISTFKQSTSGSVGDYPIITCNVPENAKYLRMSVLNAAGIFNLFIVTIGETIDSYEPYRTPTTIPVTFPSEAGTVYGGNVDLVTGVLTVTHGFLTLNTSDMNNGENWPGWQNSGIRAIVGSGINDRKNAKLNIGNKISINTSGTSAASYDVAYLDKTVYGKTETEWKTLAMDIQICIPYSTPVTYSLATSQLSTLIGTNNIYSDADSVEVTYDLAESAEMMDVRMKIYSLFNRWDYIAKTGEPDENGRAVAQSFHVDVTAGQTIIIQYEGIVDRTSGRFLFDGYYARTTVNGVSTNLYTNDMLTSNDGIVVAKATRTGTISFLAGRTIAEGTWTAFKIKSLKVRVQ